MKDKNNKIMKKIMIVGLLLIMMIVFAVAAINPALPWHPLQQISTDSGGGTSVDNNPANNVIDEADHAAEADHATNADNAVNANTVGGKTVEEISGAWTVSGDDVYRDSGKVGIGTASPSQKLQVSGGNIAIDQGSYIYLGNKPFVRLDSSSNNIYFGTSIGKSYYFFGDRMNGYGSVKTGPLTVNGEILIGNSNTKLAKGSGNSLTISTDSGYVSIGPVNYGYSHFYTDMPRYYFNKKLVINSGQISSYDEGLDFQTAETSRMTIDKDTGLVTINGDLQVDGKVVGIGYDTPAYGNMGEDIYTPISYSYCNAKLDTCDGDPIKPYTCKGDEARTCLDHIPRSGYFCNRRTINCIAQELSQDQSDEPLLVNGNEDSYSKFQTTGYNSPDTCDGDKKEPYVCQFDESRVCIDYDLYEKTTGTGYYRQRTATCSIAVVSAKVYPPQPVFYFKGDVDTSLNLELKGETYKESNERAWGDLPHAHKFYSVGIPTDGSQVELLKISGATLKITQQPSASNGYTVKIEMYHEAAHAGAFEFYLIKK